LPSREPISPASAAILAFAAIVFLLFGLAVIPYIGVQTDEAIFTNALFPEPHPWFAISIFKKKVPLMVMSYLGASKAALYTVVFDLFPPSAYSLRIPVLLLGLATIPAFYFFLRRALNPPIAVFGASLLAFDSSYLMATTLDWGPVAIQHVCLLGGSLLVLKGYQEDRPRLLYGGFFFFGLGMWDKALFAWTLSGVSIATLVVFPTCVKRFFKPRLIVMAGIFFLLGALPLVIYNVRRPLETFRGNTSFSTADLESKLNLPQATLNGSVMFGYLVEENHAVVQRSPRTALERMSIGLSDWVGERRTNLYWHAFVFALALTPVLLFTRFRRPVLFCLVFLAVAWGQMLATRNAGGGAHHVILLWPSPLMLIACALGWVGEKTRRPILVLALSGTILCASGLLVHNHYLAQAIRNGAPGVWTDAIFELSEEISRLNPKAVYLVDWGLFDNLRMLQQGKVPLYWGSEPLMLDPPRPEDVANTRHMLDTPGAIFVGNTDDRQVFAEVNPRLRKLADGLGYERELLKVIRDGNGRPAFEIFRFRKKT
jgi:hypothetical protein